MSLLSSVRDRLAALFGRDRGADDERTERSCSVCGTTVPPDDDCPLCGSTAVVTERADEAADDPPSPASEPSAETEDAAARLRDLREGEE